MKILAVFVEVTSYIISLIENVYHVSTDNDITCVFCSQSVTGHIPDAELPSNCLILEGSISKKIWHLRKELHHQHFDLMIINGYSDFIRSGLIQYCRCKKIPYCIEVDTQLMLPSSRIKAQIKSLYLHRIFENQAYGFAGGTRQRRLFEYYGMDSSHIFTMPMTIDVEYFRKTVEDCPGREELKEKYGVGSGPVILFVGRLTKVKNIPLLMEVLSKLEKDTVLVIVGKGEEEARLRKKAIELRVDDRVYFFEYQTMPCLAEFYKLADVFVLPSYFEQWGLVINEALSCGIPCVVSDKAGAADDLIMKNRNGFIFESGNAEDLADKIVRALKASFCQKEISACMDKWNYEVYAQSFRNAVNLIQKYSRDGKE
ncbi:Glycosyltransferase involved in cell wall bisynthesis [Parasporobacterium paucivorans DSM 15970]|uniref:Glycosyltransferase involved in cell wall bisynthesis n=2 Tax=Parasporobacterium TaxID=115543 RepID=A0A1M6GUN4_9FIRM|nr:Glycosyltransferase involved in cell wall bisynthesis [Parasporobacterium paucivorans DSM 15970]